MNLPQAMFGSKELSLSIVSEYIFNYANLPLSLQELDNKVILTIFF